MRTVCDTQQTRTWFECRLGKVTASEAAAVLSRYKTKSRENDETAERYGYKMQLLAERLTGKVTSQFVSIWMKGGSDYEDDARARFECEQELLVEQTGFVLHPKLDFFGASPDGLLPDNGVLELKVPTPGNHLKYLLGKLDPREEHGAQMVGEIICCEADYCMFGSYNPDFPPHLKLFTKRYERGDIMQISAYEEAIVQFNAEIEEMLEKLAQKWNGEQ